MALYTCPDCGKQYSDLVTVCPKCATPRMVPSSHSPTASRHATRAFWTDHPYWTAFAVLLVVSVLSAPFRGNPSHRSASASAAQAEFAAPLPSVVDDGWRSLIANIYEGTDLYLKSDKAFIGTVVEINDNAVFEDGTRGEGIRIRFPEGRPMWMPRKTAQLLYITRAKR